MRTVSDDAAEGLAGYVKLGNGGEATADDLLAKIGSSGGVSGEIIADSSESVAEALNKTYKHNISGGAPHLDDLKRVDDAVIAARGTFDPHLRDSVVNPNLGPSRAIKTMEEFEALRFVRAEDLRPEQVEALNSIRRLVQLPADGGGVARVMPIDNAAFGSRNMIETGNANFSGNFAVAGDLNGIDTSAEIVERLRLDYAGTPFVPGAAYAILDTPMNQTIRTNTKIPRSAAFDGAAGDGLGTVVTEPFPRTGNGFTASRDGYLTPEWKATPAQMNAGAAGAPPVTTMKFRFADGSVYPQTIVVDGVQHIASDWKLIPHPSLQGQFQWVPDVP